MKNKRLKSSTISYSTKTKPRNQEKNNEINGFLKKNENLMKNYEIPVHIKEQYRQKRLPPHNATNDSGPFIFDNTSSEEVTGSNYSYKAKTQKCYKYQNYTNSAFLYFLGKLSPKEYVVFITILGMIIVEPMNLTEIKVLYSFITNIANAVYDYVEQQTIIDNIKSIKTGKEQADALQKDFDTLYNEVNLLKKNCCKKPL